MAAQKLHDAFFIYTGKRSIKTSGYDLANQVDAKGSCVLLVNDSAYDLQSAVHNAGTTTLTFSIGTVAITENIGAVTGLHLIDASNALSGQAAGSYARLLLYDGHAFKEFQFLA